MKKARQVEVPTDRELTEDEYIDLSSHAHKSSLWYVSTYVKNSHQVREKLNRKGYPNENVCVKAKDGTIRDVNLIDDALKELIDMGMLDDVRYIDDIYSSGRNSGKSIGAIRLNLIRSGLPSDFVSEHLDALVEENEANDDDDESVEHELLDRAANKVIASSRFENMDQYKKRQTLVKKLAAKGFSMGDIFAWMDEHPITD